ncbi:MAG: rsmD [Rhodospirillales bacterium]|nr:rsmD [Rhodospirillales bacterium]
MRIVAGNHRGRRLEAPTDERIRPTSDRIRESLFNILHHRLEGFTGKRVLDGFAGTGALGFEALSRGAVSALFVDNNRDALALCRRNAASLGLTAQADFRLADLTHLPQSASAFDLILLDPPYGKGLACTALGALAAGGWLAPKAIAVVEADRSQPEIIPDGFSTIDSRDYGRTRITLVRWSAAA